MMNRRTNKENRKKTNIIKKTKCGITYNYVQINLINNYNNTNFIKHIAIKSIVDIENITTNNDVNGYFRIEIYGKFGINNEVIIGHCLIIQKINCNCYLIHQSFIFNYEYKTKFINKEDLIMFIDDMFKLNDTSKIKEIFLSRFQVNCNKIYNYEGTNITFVTPSFVWNIMKLNKTIKWFSKCDYHNLLNVNLQENINNCDYVG